MIGKRIRFLFFAVCIGGSIGAFIWGFLRIMGIGQELLFTALPKQVHMPYFVLLVCIVGGVSIGYGMGMLCSVEPEFGAGVSTILQKKD